jgi:hypothetical protein
VILSRGKREWRREHARQARSGEGQHRVEQVEADRLDVVGVKAGLLGPAPG